jgi:phosphoribosylanthranilate isomerase
MRTRIKICGLTRESDVDAAVESGIDALGFVFFGASPRAVSADRARLLVRRLPAWVASVGLFVNAPRDEVLRTADTVGLSHLQLHGDETPDNCMGLGRPVIKAIRVRATANEQSVDHEAQRLRGLLKDFSDCQAILLDADSAGFGGSGQAFDWAVVEQAGLSRQMRGKSPGMPPAWVLSGGLESGSVGQAIHRLRPPCVDVSSGVERWEGDRLVKGEKDAQRMKAFVDAVRLADQTIT